MKEWTLAWSDEFDGPAGAPPDPLVWRAETGGGGWGNDELQDYTGGTANAALDGEGRLAVTVRRDGDRHTSARLITKGLASFSYGLVTARIRLPRGRGVWPAFWMLGDNIDDVGWPACGEIDIMENFGIDGTGRLVQGTVHGPGYSGADGIAATMRADVELADDFHDFSVMREPGRIRWFLDDRVFHTVTPRECDPWVFGHEFYLLLNVAVGGRFSAAPDDGVLPQTMLVEHVRHYV